MAIITVQPAAILGTNDFTAQQRVSSGSEDAPSWSFTSETDTGMFLSAANALGFATAGAERWTINSSGHLLATDDATYDLGASGATRPRDLFLSRNITIGGIIAVPDGSAANPPFTNIGDTNTGWYFPSDEQLAATITGVLRLNITAAGVFAAVPLAATTDGGVELGVASFRFSNLNISGAANIGGDINHDGGNIGFHGATPRAQQTLTLTAADLTDNSGGTSGGTTIAAIGQASVDTSAALRTDTRNAIATLAAMVDKNTADMASLKSILSEASGGVGLIV